MRIEGHLHSEQVAVADLPDPAIYRKCQLGDRCELVIDQQTGHQSIDLKVVPQESLEHDAKGKD